MDRLKQILSKSLLAPGQGSHPNADTLSAYAENALSRGEQQEVLGHVADCKDCRDILFLAQPDSAERQVVTAYRPARLWHFAFRWGAVAASLVIVAGGVFLARQEFFRAEHKSSYSATIPYNDKVANEKTPADLDSRRIAEPAAPTPPAKENGRIDLSAGAPSKPRPEEKHMTAKLQSPLKFEGSDQVQMAPAANAWAEEVKHENVPVAGQNAVASSRVLDESPASPRATAKAKDDAVLSYSTGMGAAQSSAANKFGGTVIDPDGAAVANAQVTMVGPAGEKTVTSDSAGKFSFDQLTPGSYALKAKAPGFRQTEIRQVAVVDHKTTDIAVKLDVGSMAETVEISAAAQDLDARQEAKIAGALLSANALPSPQTTAEVVARDQKQAAKPSRRKAAAEPEAGMAGKATPQAQWTLAADGMLQRSLDSGKSWKGVPVGNMSGFRALFSADSDVWVGGKAGTLYHSSDSGQTWKLVTPSSNGEKLAADISHIEFTDPTNGSISAVNGETWLTSDGGQTWRKK